MESMAPVAKLLFRFPSDALIDDAMSIDELAVTRLRGRHARRQAFHETGKQAFDDYGHDRSKKAERPKREPRRLPGTSFGMQVKTPSSQFRSEVPSQ
jgi:hypothetical protein